MRKVAVALLLAAVVWAGMRWATFAIGGSDSYCYAYQAERWASLLRRQASERKRLLAKA